MKIGGFQINEDSDKVFTPEEMVVYIREHAHPFLIESCMVYNQFSWGFEPVIGEVIKKSDTCYIFKEMIGENKRKCLNKDEYSIDDDGNAYRIISLEGGEHIPHIRSAAKLKNKPYVQSCVIFTNKDNTPDVVLDIWVINDEKSRNAFIDRLMCSFLEFTKIDTLRDLNDAVKYVRSTYRTQMGDANFDIYKENEYRIPIEKETYFNQMEKMIFEFIDDKTLIDKYYES